MNPPTVSIVIVSYNTRELLRACLASLRAHAPEAEVIVVDNASSDGSAAMVTADFPEVVLLAQGENRWYCGGNNLGAAAARGRYVLFLNPDTVVRAGAVQAMVAFLDAHPDYAGATCQLRYPDGSIQQTCSRRITYAYLWGAFTPLALLPGVGQALRRRFWYADWGRDTDRDVEAVPGSCTLLRREDARMDDDLLLYFPEDALAARLRRPFRFLSSAVIEHHEKSSTANWQARRIFFRDLLTYTRRCHGAWQAAILAPGAYALLGLLWLRWKVRQP
ncbi:MAG: glycosyltransferase family 2 protein [Anaerolineae bacterium]